MAWYQGMLEHLLVMGAAAIKTDFGENVDPDADYCGMPADKLHNLYSLLYQEAASEITQHTTGEGIIWARSGWAGCQRYPVHWDGDAACSWDGLAASIRGGLHLGLSGFGFWSHDVPGFRGVPNFMNSWLADDLYVRWTQFGVSSSHLRYHGSCPREPYEYPAVAEIVREWLKMLAQTSPGALGAYACVRQGWRSSSRLSRSRFVYGSHQPDQDHTLVVRWALSLHCNTPRPVSLVWAWEGKY